MDVVHICFIFIKMNPKVDAYFAEGCGRCEWYQTPQCKVNFYIEPMEYLRELLLETELREDYKWSQPCYTLNGKNVIMLSALKDFCCLAFFKGVLLEDKHHILVSPGAHSQSDRQLRFTETEQVINQKHIIKAYIAEAIALEKSEAKVEMKERDALVFPEELLDLFDQNPRFKKAFEALTPGRQRGYNLHFCAPKQSKTRKSRIEKCIPKILEGKGFHDR